MKKLLAIAALLCVGSCSRGYDSDVLNLKFKTPRGFKLVEEKAGPPATAHFEPGLDIISVSGQPDEIKDGQLRELLQHLNAEHGVATTGEIISSRPGTLATGPVARFALKSEAGRTLLYYVPVKDRFIVVRFTAPEGQYGDLESHVEMALGSMRLR